VAVAEQSEMKTRTKSRWLVGLGLLIAGLTLIAFAPWKDFGENRHQLLADGSYLVLREVKFGEKQEFGHGTPWEKMLGNVIPAKGLRLLGFKLERPTRLSLGTYGKSQLVAEFKILGTNAANHQLVAPRFYRQYRCVVHGEGGIEFVEEFWPSIFKKYSDGSFGYVVTGRFPRDSHWLWFRVEKQETRDALWQTVAEFKIRNLSRPANRPWVAAPSPVTKIFEGLEFTLGEVTMEMKLSGPKDIWNQTVLLPIRVVSNGITLTNWTANYIHAEDASGNSGYYGTISTVTNGWVIHRNWRGLDPRFVWKLEMDLEPASDFPTESLHAVSVPTTPSAKLVTNLVGIPVTISWVNQSMLSVQIPTNRTDLALRFVSAENLQGANIDQLSGSWNQHGFWRSMDLSAANGDMRATIALVKNVHLQFYLQPRLITREDPPSQNTQSH